MEELSPNNNCNQAQVFSARQLNTYCFMPQAAPLNELPLQIAAVPVFLSAAEYEQMQQIISAIETVIHSAEWQKRALADAPEIARHNPGNAGVLFGYDFHLAESGPKLIEINTNAGGALIVTEILRSQTGCCSATGIPSPHDQAARAETAIINSLIQDFSTVNAGLPRVIAIVDVNPVQQYLYPEFLRFASLLRERGMDVEICDPSELIFSDGNLFVSGKKIDLVYNRLTDFYFADESSAALRQAYLHGQTVISPNPFHHAVYANKQNLIWLTDPLVLSEMNVDKALQEILLHGIPETKGVTRSQAEQLWAERNSIFLSPPQPMAEKVPIAAPS